MGRGGAMQSEVIQREVLSSIAERMADQALDHVDTVLDPMFLKSKDVSRVSIDLFKEFIIRDLKANLSERDIDLFIKSHPVLS